MENSQLKDQVTDLKSEIVEKDKEILEKDNALTQEKYKCSVLEVQKEIYVHMQSLIQQIY